MKAKKDLLLVYEDLSFGGSTTSLEAFLNAIDRERFNVHLLVYRKNNPEFLERLPKDINILREAAVHGNSTIDKLMKGAKVFFAPSYYRAKKAQRRGANKYVVLQHMSYAKVRLCRREKKEYDAAIAFIEGWSSSYVLSSKVKAKKKAVFLHLDYKTAGADADIDRKAFGKADALITVSECCRNSLASLYPEYSKKITYIENIHSVELIKKKSEDPLPDSVDSHYEFLTVCRPDVYVKGLDRLVNVAKALKSDGMSFKWYVLGAGGNSRFENMVHESGLEGYVVPVKATDNPFPYYLRADWLVVTSRTEAKPMTVTEAQILGVPCIVTDYCSAKEQVNNGIDGIIAENSENGIYEAIKKALESPHLREKYAEALKAKRFDQSDSLQRLYEIID